jgi:hypothetical protein
MRSLVLCIVVLFFVLVPTPGTDQLLPGCHSAHAQAGSCTSTVIDSASGYAPELGVSWSSRTYWSACEDAVGNITFHYTTIFVMIFDSGAMYVHMNVS